MATSNECVCCTELHDGVCTNKGAIGNCITNPDEYRAHIHPAVVETFFKMNRKKRKKNKNNKPFEGPGRQLSNE